MSRKRRNGAATQRQAYASVFAALGDETRLSLVAKLSASRPRSITQLAKGSRLTRQAITKHLQVLERAGIVRSIRSGRENLCAFEPGRINEAKAYLDSVSKQWDQVLSRLNAFAEDRAQTLIAGRSLQIEIR